VGMAWAWASNWSRGAAGARIRAGVLLTALLATVYFGCTQDEGTRPGDEAAPVVEILSPEQPIGQAANISDSVVVVARARDESGIATVEFFRRSQVDSTSRLIPGGRLTSPDSVSDGWSYYSVLWRTGVIANGNYVQVFARAMDLAENQGQSSDLVVRILNTAELRAPVPCFLIDPPGGNIETVFSFSASCTYDNVDPIQELTTRWDFNSDGLWDRDTTESITPLERVSWTFTAPGTYRVKLQVFNTYYDDPGELVTELEVTNVGGDPNPQSEMIRIAGGTYVIGAVNPDGASADELRIHPITVSTFFIEKREVTNALYRRYLNAARDTKAIVFIPPDVVRDTLGNKMIDFNTTKIFFDVEEEADSFRVSPGFEDHPVTGVSWAGATAYSLFFGLRLPTEREWEIAARADSSLWRYPRGRNIDPSAYNYFQSGDPYDEGTTPTGFYDGTVREGYATLSGASPWGVEDLSGNVAEWVRDWFEPDYALNPPPNYQGPPSSPEGFKSVRGGSYLSGPSGLRVTNREATHLTTMSPQIGFRTAYTFF